MKTVIYAAPQIPTGFACALVLALIGLLTVINGEASDTAEVVAQEAAASQTTEQRALAGALAMCRNASGSPETIAVLQSDGQWTCATHRGHRLRVTLPARPALVASNAGVQP